MSKKFSCPARDGSFLKTLRLLEVFSEEFGDIDFGGALLILHACTNSLRSVDNPVARAGTGFPPVAQIALKTVKRWRKEYGQ